REPPSGPRSGRRHWPWAGLTREAAMANKMPGMGRMPGLHVVPQPRSDDEIALIEGREQDVFQRHRLAAIHREHHITANLVCVRKQVVDGGKIEVAEVETVAAI